MLYLVGFGSQLTLYYKLSDMRHSQKENQASTLNESLPKHKKYNEFSKLNLTHNEDYFQKIAILKQSALQALAEKNQVIEHLTYTLDHHRQLTHSLNDQKAEDGEFMELLVMKLNQKNEELENASEELKKKEGEIERYRDQMENVQWQRQQLLAQLERYQVQNQDLRQMINQLVTENQKLKQTLRNINPLQKTVEYENNSLSSVQESAEKNKTIHLDSKYDYCLNLHSEQKIQTESALHLNRSPSLNFFKLERTKSIAEFTNAVQENDLIDFHEHSMATQEMKESLVKKHCLGLSLKAINLIDTYSVNSASKKVTDCESQMTARYFHYVNDKDLERGCEGNSADELEMQSYEDIVEQPQEQQAEQQNDQHPVKQQRQDLFAKLRWSVLGALFGVTLTLLFKK